MAEEKNLLEGISGSFTLDGHGGVKTNITMNIDGDMVAECTAAMIDALIELVMPKRMGERYVFLSLVSALALDRRHEMEKNMRIPIPDELRKICDDLARDMVGRCVREVVTNEEGGEE